MQIILWVQDLRQGNGPSAVAASTSSAFFAWTGSPELVESLLDDARRDRCGPRPDRPGEVEAGESAAPSSPVESPTLARPGTGPPPSGAVRTCTAISFSSG
jgi:hypothetical protein